jgi:predicted Rossmann fold flavoprotein
VKKRVIVVGGGAAGMTAAVAAGRLGAEVTILEKNPRVGKKILATGNGRCNFTNIGIKGEQACACYHGANPEFARSALAQFSVAETLRFFEKLGIAHKVEDEGKVFPRSDQASSILDVFLYELNELGVNILCDARVIAIRKNGKDGEFRVELESGEVHRGDAVIIATGGKAAPITGSDGDGFLLAQKLGHTVTDLFPALVQLMLEGEFFPRIAGVKLVGTAEILYNNESLAKDRGDILFADYGVSGPPILQISRKAGELLNAGKEAYLQINIMDTLTKEELRQLLKKRFQDGGKKPVDFSLVGLINKRLIPVILMEAGLGRKPKDWQFPAAALSAEAQERILQILTGWRFKIRRTRSWPSAQVTAGGVDTREIDEKIMESKLVPGLFFAGEVIDIDGACGGFNLQWAWSSGYIAGRNAAS